MQIPRASMRPSSRTLQGWPWGWRTLWRGRHTIRCHSSFIATASNVDTQLWREFASKASGEHQSSGLPVYVLTCVPKRRMGGHHSLLFSGWSASSTSRTIRAFSVQRVGHGGLRLAVTVQHVGLRRQAHANVSRATHDADRGM